MENRDTILKGFQIIRDMLAPYIARELSSEYGSDVWWRDGVMKILRDEQKRGLPADGDYATVTDTLDVFACLLLFDLHWQYIFKKKLSIDHRTWAKELMGYRNKTAHIGGKDFSEGDTWRALDTMSRLAEQIDSESAEEIKEMLRTVRYGTADASTTVTDTTTAATSAAKPKTVGILESTPVSGLPCWRDVMQPHPDVAQGRYKNAEFAADLAQVARGEGSYEYRDPVEFFARTYVTEGMAGLLEQALRRVCGKDGEPVIQLKTAFGGGKTHSMLAIYHMMRGTVSVDKIPIVKPVLEQAEVTSLPKANVAVLVGTSLDPSKSKVPSYLPGVTINTLWGEIAAQLAYSAGKPELYNFIKESDKKHVAPGSETLKNLFDAAAPCIILMDELVAYAKVLYGRDNLPAGTFDNFITFIQQITEAARASKNSLVVASIPESDIEIGGDSGKKTLETIEHTFGRMESIWKPVAASEGFEVVRRRLFLDCKNTEARDKVCAEFSRFYNENQNDFPLEAREVEYMERMISCYPIHPEIFDKLYEEWATLERFQRTRGVLRLMAAVIHELWMGNDAGLMIMPGSIPLDAPNVRHELLRNLEDNERWSPIIDSEVDGRNSVPYKKDQANQRYGRCLASRRVARAIMLGSAPSVRDQNVRGIEASRIRLGVVQPGENISSFIDALNTLTTSLSYLYVNSSGDRFWYDTRPTLRKLVEDRSTQISASDVEYEIETRLRGLRRESPFSGIHICPASSNDVPDEQSVRLVILRPTDTYKASEKDCNAMTTVTDILDNRGSSPRIYRNMLAFVAPDTDLMASLKQAVKLRNAWLSIYEDRESLNLDASQNKEAKNSLDRANETVDAQVRETYCWLLIPYIDKDTDMKTIVWETIKISGGSDGIITKAAKKMSQSEAVITTWAPALLKMELDNLLWREANHIAVKQLWEYLCTYCYLPRLANEDVLFGSIRNGVNSEEYFAFASAFDEERYVDLKLNQLIGTVERSGYLVKVGTAQNQITAEKTKETEDVFAVSGTETGGQNAITTGQDGSSSSGNMPTGHSSDDADTQEVPDIQKSKRFFMSADLDITRINRDVQNYVEEIIRHLSTEDGTRVKISLEVHAENDSGFTQQTVRTISENCRTLRVEDSGFGE